MNLLKKFLLHLWLSAGSKNQQNIIDLCETDNNARFVDLGCDDGKWTMKVAKKINTKLVFGLDFSKKQLQKAGNLGIKTAKGDLNEILPYRSNFFAVVHSNQVIEHLVNTDNFVSEIYRILKPGGYAIVSTENLSSWHNIIALILGWQAFSQHISKLYHIGNPFSPHYEKKLKSGWTHNIIFTYFGLQKLFIKYGFIVEELKGAGYYPLPNFIARLDPRHAHFITIKARKP
ncbi:hypothetical protein A3C98_02630 [Candidatus Roizmanbacteria bacterium RIFCSPHIGHO2_02_FULL_37_15]|nr:MAG: hypothetical protein A3C98_02630 [Candidatus Roizmanbacteria bacterium RIFCSPHIGHO2_02_FULL_37_15]OGK31846.1 MAG: hypothetical protein A3F57_01845 [Candidatus Roizmanbacteria bacterium RIFCSPHIGHO2_12_FULL_36_11]OGK57800.1 MAG: hypothetical protein A3I50_04525 [Candidatus Roizmanbacteria bacterium RIFCSPLOWO2_02_FULL_37_9]